jgi:prevent-host-death family protein
MRPCRGGSLYSAWVGEPLRTGGHGVAARWPTRPLLRRVVVRSPPDNVPRPRIDSARHCGTSRSRWCAPRKRPVRIDFTQAGLPSAAQAEAARCVLPSPIPCRTSSGMCDDGLVIDLSLMKEIRVGSSLRVARTAGGVGANWPWKPSAVGIFAGPDGDAERALRPLKVCYDCYGGARVTTIPHRELRNRSSEVLRRVQAGETIQVTNHGVVVAVLSPPGTVRAPRIVAARHRGGFASIVRMRASETTRQVLDALREE